MKDPTGTQTGGVGLECRDVSSTVRTVQSAWGALYHMKGNGVSRSSLHPGLSSLDLRPRKDLSHDLCTLNIDKTVSGRFV